MRTHTLLPEMLTCRDYETICATMGGGTSWKVALADTNKPDVILERATFPTTTPDETLGKIDNQDTLELLVGVSNKDGIVPTLQNAAKFK